MKNIRFFTFLLCLTFLVGGCKKFLDKLPDTRAELNTVEKVKSLLVTAYPQAAYQKFAELMSDNAQDKGPVVSQELMDYTYFQFGDFISDAGTQDGTVAYWAGAYAAIASANAALEAISLASDPQNYTAEKGEALLCRAYSHFMLVTLFSKPYNETTSATDLGIPYVTKPEKVVFENYTRGTVKDVYEKIEKDLLEGLPLIANAQYDVPKYHFRPVSANAFASRFYLYKKEYAKSIQHANAAFANDAALVQSMRPWLTVYPTYTVALMQQNYTKATTEANLLLVECPSLWARHTTSSRFGFTPQMYAGTFFTTPNPAGINAGRYIQSSWIYIRGGQTNYFVPKWQEFFYAPVNPNYGNPYIMSPLFTTEEVLFNRAEAKIQLGQNAEALADLNLYLSRRVTNYAQADNITTAKALAYAGGTDVKEALIKSCLFLKRIEFIQEGMRWFDVLRYNLPVTHNYLDVNNEVVETYTLGPDDKRRQLQIPQTAQSAGIEANPR